MARGFGARESRVPNDILGSAKYAKGESPKEVSDKAKKDFIKETKGFKGMTIEELKSALNLKENFVSFYTGEKMRDGNPVSDENAKAYGRAQAIKEEIKNRIDAENRKGVRASFGKFSKLIGAGTKESKAALDSVLPPALKGKGLFRPTGNIVQTPSFDYDTPAMSDEEYVEMLDSERMEKVTGYTSDKPIEVAGKEKGSKWILTEEAYMSGKINQDPKTFGIKINRRLEYVDANGGRKDVGNWTIYTSEGG